MSAGEIIDRAQRRAGRASGTLVFMIVKRRIARGDLEYALQLLEAAADDIRSVLTPDLGGDKLPSQPQERLHDDDGTSNPRG